MKKFINLQKLLLILFLCLFIFKVNGQTKFDKTSTQWAEIKKLKAKVEADPSNLKSHEAFIEAYNSDDPALGVVYKDWMQKFPKTFAVPFAIGQAYVDRENPKATAFLLQASILKPDQAEVWSLLAQDAAFRNDIVSKKEYLQKTVQYDSKNPGYALDYAYSFKDTDPAKYDSLSIEVTRRFPESDAATEALYLLASNSTVPAEQIVYYKQIQSRKSSQLSKYYLFAMTNYFDLLLNTNPDQAFELGLNLILDSKRNLNLWKDRIKVADAFIKARKLLQDKEPKQALALLNQVKLGNANEVPIDAKESLLLFKAEAADAANQTATAYDSLANYYSKTPSDQLHNLLILYGQKLGMDSNSVAKSIWKIRNSEAKQAKDFSLENYLTQSKTALSDYQGKVILLTYWFPGCSPCRAEFPHFEAVLKNFNKNEVAYLGLNLEPSQDGFVLPFLKETGSTFIALRDNPARDKGNLPADGAPTNYLIDQKGRIVFSNFRIDKDNEKTLELMIKETLAAKEE